MLRTIAQFDFYKWLGLLKIAQISSNKFILVKFEPSNVDRKAAWDLYVEIYMHELLNPLANKTNSENKKIRDFFEIFAVTRSILKDYGSQSIGFAKVAVVLLNHIIRPFTGKWHKLSEEFSFEDSALLQAEFRMDLNELQTRMRVYTSLLAEMAGFEDFLYEI